MVLQSKILGLATHNAGKERELQTLLAPLGFEVKTAKTLHVPEPLETGLTFAENALLKARHMFEHTGLPSLADDSGLVVDALDGAPGIYSARWAGESKDFTQAMAKILRLLDEKGVSDEKRTARFVCVLALVENEKEQVFEGVVEGLIVSPRGSLGFGYDPIFLPEGIEKTFGEMTSEEKHGLDAALSHRARAFKALMEAL